MTEDGRVECDASVMDGDSGAFGAVGATPGSLQILTFFSYKTGGVSLRTNFHSSEVNGQQVLEIPSRLLCC